MGGVAERTQIHDWERLHALALRETRRVLDPHAAEDAAQEAVLRAWRFAHTRTASDPEPWIRTIARREALRIIARRSFEKLPESFEWEAACDEHAASARRLDLMGALTALAARDREILLLRYWADRTDTQIATQTGLPIGTVKTRIHRAHAKLARSARSRDSDMP